MVSFDDSPNIIYISRHSRYALSWWHTPFSPASQSYRPLLLLYNIHVTLMKHPFLPCQSILPTPPFAVQYPCDLDETPLSPLPVNPTDPSLCCTISMWLWWNTPFSNQSHWPLLLLCNVRLTLMTCRFWPILFYHIKNGEQLFWF